LLQVVLVRLHILGGQLRVGVCFLHEAVVPNHRAVEECEPDILVLVVCCPPELVRGLGDCPDLEAQNVVVVLVAAIHDVHFGLVNGLLLCSDPVVLPCQGRADSGLAYSWRALDCDNHTS
jgi:hypothetical protein